MMHLTPVMLERAYEYLRSTAPFNKWRLPAADGVEFRVKKMNAFGYCDTDYAGKRAPIIALSSVRCGRTAVLIETMAHEMVHLYQDTSAAKGRAPTAHGSKFQKLAAQVCRIHGFDKATF